MRTALQLHVAERLYFIKNAEWEMGAEGYKALNQRRRKARQAQMRARLQAASMSAYLAGASALVNIGTAIESVLDETSRRYKEKLAERRGDVVATSREVRMHPHLYLLI